MNLIKLWNAVIGRSPELDAAQQKFREAEEEFTQTVIQFNVQVAQFRRASEQIIEEDERSQKELNDLQVMAENGR